MNKSLIVVMAAIAIGAYAVFMLYQSDENQTGWQQDNAPTEQQWNFKSQAVTPPA